MLENTLLERNFTKILELEIIDINQIAKNSGLFEKNDESNDVDVKKLKKIFRDKKFQKNSHCWGHLAPYVLTKKM